MDLDRNMVKIRPICASLAMPLFVPLIPLDQQGLHVGLHGRVPGHGSAFPKASVLFIKRSESPVGQSSGGGRSWFRPRHNALQRALSVLTVQVGEGLKPQPSHIRVNQPMGIGRGQL
jgi:hypothetical protein